MRTGSIQIGLGAVLILAGAVATAVSYSNAGPGGGFVIYIGLVAVGMPLIYRESVRRGQVTRADHPEAYVLASAQPAIWAALFGSPGSAYVPIWAGLVTPAGRICVSR